MEVVALRACPFCGSENIDAEGWASTDRAGPACDDCGASADTVEIWNSRPGEDRLNRTVQLVMAHDSNLIDYLESHSK